MFEWLKDLFESKKKPVPKKASTPQPCGHVKIDSRTHPLINISTKAFIAGEADDNLIKDQMVALSVTIDDSHGKFSFSTRCIIVNIDSNRRFTCAFSLLPPEIEQALNQYAKNRAAYDAKRAQDAKRAKALQAIQEAKGGKTAKRR